MDLSWQFQSVFSVQTRASWVFPKNLRNVQMWFAQTDLICDSDAGESVFFILVTCSESSKNYYRSKSYSQTGSAAFCHSSSLPAFPYENKLFGSPPAIQTDAVVRRYLKGWVQESFHWWGCFCCWYGFWEVRGRGWPCEERVISGAKNYCFVLSNKNKTGCSCT